ncbi:conserved hypothetical protein [Streptomyces sp. e14]|nr:conserved hypothetical protein [Streptomyces sp. e14]
MSESYRGRRCGRSTAFPNLWARQSHPRVDELDSASTTTRHFDNRASCFSLDSTSASYQEALPPCTRPGQLTRTRPPFEPVRPRERIENRQLGSQFGASLEDHGPNVVLHRAGPQTARRAGTLRGHDHSRQNSSSPKPLHRPLVQTRAQALALPLK